MVSPQQNSKVAQHGTNVSTGANPKTNSAAEQQLYAQIHAQLFPEKSIYFSLAGIVVPLMIFVPKFLISAMVAGSDFGIKLAYTTTPILDIIINIVQIVMIICLCFSHNRHARVSKRCYLTIGFYYASAYIFWMFHFIGYRVPTLIVVIKYLLPCLAVYFYANDNPNKVAKYIIIVFAILHLASGALNYVVDLQTILSFFNLAG